MDRCPLQKTSEQQPVRYKDIKYEDQFSSAYVFPP